MDAASDSHNKIKLASFVGDVGMLSSSTTETSRHKPRPCSVFVKKLLTVDNSDVSCDVETKQPPFLCRCCVTSFIAEYPATDLHVIE